MGGFGYRFMSDTLIRNKSPGAVVYNGDSRDPSIGGTRKAGPGLP
jgi:hypothetical protein